MPKPRAVILGTRDIVEAFYTEASKMSVCEYDIDEILQIIFKTIGSAECGDPAPSDQSGMLRNLRLYQRINYSLLNEHDATILRRATNTLARKLHDQCVVLGMYDEQGRMDYYPTGWLCQYDIVLTLKGEEAVACKEVFRQS